MRLTWSCASPDARSWRALSHQSRESASGGGPQSPDATRVKSPQVINKRQKLPRGYLGLGVPCRYVDDAVIKFNLNDGESIALNHSQPPFPQSQRLAASHRANPRGTHRGPSTSTTQELELELIQSHMAQKPVLRGEMGRACVAREVSVERGGMGDFNRAVHRIIDTRGHLRSPLLPGLWSIPDENPQVLGLGIGESAASVIYLLDSIRRLDVYRAKIFRCSTWVAPTTSRPRRPLACSAQGPVACGVMRPFSPGAASSWTGAASSLACSRPPPAPRARLATPILTSRTTASSTPSPRTPDAVFTPVRGGRTGTSTSSVSASGEVRGCTCWRC